MSQVEDEKSPPGSRGSPLLVQEQESLKQLVAVVGERAAAVRLGLARHTLARALGGLGLYPPTAFLIRQRLADVASAIADQECPANPNNPGA